MPDWDENSPQLRNNLFSLFEGIREEAQNRKPVTLAKLKQWHRAMMHGLTADSQSYIGAFRGEKGLEHIGVRIGAQQGTPPHEVGDELAVFEETLSDLIHQIDATIPRGQLPDDSQIAAVISACGWAHAEWVRIHPFANGNGRTARILANAIAMRYGLPPFVQLRPRPEGKGYAGVSAQAMRGNYQPTITLFRQMLGRVLSE